MDQFFTLNFTGGPFVLFSKPHWIALSVIVLINICLVLFRARFHRQCQASLPPRSSSRVSYQRNGMACLEPGHGTVDDPNHDSAAPLQRVGVGFCLYVGQEKSGDL